MLTLAALLLAIGLRQPAAAAPAPVALAAILSVLLGSVLAWQARPLRALVGQFVARRPATRSVRAPACHPAAGDHDHHRPGRLHRPGRRPWRWPSRCSCCVRCRHQPPAPTGARTLASLPASGPEVGSPAPPIRRPHQHRRPRSTPPTWPAARTWSPSCPAAARDAGPPCRPWRTTPARRPARCRLIVVITGDRQRAPTSSSCWHRSPPWCSSRPAARSPRRTGSPSSRPTCWCRRTATVLATGQSVLDLPQPQPR